MNKALTVSQGHSKGFAFEQTIKNYGPSADGILALS